MLDDTIYKLTTCHNLDDLARWKSGANSWLRITGNAAFLRHGQHYVALRTAIVENVHNERHFTLIA